MAVEAQGSSMSRLVPQSEPPKESWRHKILVALQLIMAGTHTIPPGQSRI